MSESSLILLSLLIGACLWIMDKRIKESETRLVKVFQLHQDWLFNQLYTMAPGKVLKPDEIEEEVENMPAVVINPNKDPMNEFNGKMNDWG